MTVRLLDATPKELLAMDKDELLNSIRSSEGRVILSEVIVQSSLFREISNAEVAAAFGADLILLNLYDVKKPFFANLPVKKGEEIVKKVKELTGCPVGVNLEPVDENVNGRIDISIGRRGNRENALEAVKQGFDFLVLTGNPSTGVTNQRIIEVISEIKDEVGNDIIIMAGKMHMAGVSEKYLDKDLFKAMIDTGVDIILLPTPGTVPGISVEDLKFHIDIIHNMGGMVMNTIGTSQESADQETIKNLAIASKVTGADIHHIGDAGYGGIAIPENILSLSIAIRGRRHTYKRMARSINR